VIYLRHRLEHAGLAAPHRIGVARSVGDRLGAEVIAELRAAFPDARVDFLGGHPGPLPLDLLVLPFTRHLHRRVLREKGALVLRGLRIPSRAVLFYDVAHRRTEVVRRRALPWWYAQRLVETLVIAGARTLRWRRS
jgi:hypothetical protein